MPSTSETILAALHARLVAGLPGVEVLRNSALPEALGAAGLVILNDGDPGEPEFIMSPPMFAYEHRAEIDVIVDAADAAARDTAFDALKLAIGTAIRTDRTLGGRCDYVMAEAPAPQELPVEGASGLKAATIGVILSYVAPDPLG